MLHIYTDGSLIENWKASYGGWAYIIEIRDGKGNLLGEVSDSGGLVGTTNMRMELLGIIRALQQVTGSQEVKLFTDSKVLKYQIEKKLATWESCKFNNGRLRDADLWKQLAVLIQNHHVKVFHVYGHTGVEQNERCDKMAKKAAEQRKFKLMDFGYLMYTQKADADRKRLAEIAKEKGIEYGVKKKSTENKDEASVDGQDKPEKEKTFKEIYAEEAKKNATTKAKKKERNKKKMEKRQAAYKSSAKAKKEAKDRKKELARLRQAELEQVEQVEQAELEQVEQVEQAELEQVEQVELEQVESVLEQDEAMLEKAETKLEYAEA